jgi:hypothetical protein
MNSTATVSDSVPAFADEAEMRAAIRAAWPCTAVVTVANVGDFECFDTLADPAKWCWGCSMSSLPIPDCPQVPMLAGDDDDEGEVADNNDDDVRLAFH